MTKHRTSSRRSYRPSSRRPQREIDAQTEILKQLEELNEAQNQTLEKQSQTDDAVSKIAREQTRQAEELKQQKITISKKPSFKYRIIKLITSIIPPAIIGLILQALPQIDRVTSFIIAFTLFILLYYALSIDTEEQDEAEAKRHLEGDDDVTQTENRDETETTGEDDTTDQTESMPDISSLKDGERPNKKRSNLHNGDESIPGKQISS